MKRFDKLKQSDLDTVGKFRAGRPTELLVVHCSASREGTNYTARDAYELHTKERGWKDIGYHFYIELDGSIVVGRPLSQVGAHVEGKNTGSIGVCYAGGLNRSGTPADTRTVTQHSSLVRILTALVRDNPDIVRIAGHNQYSSKACPSFNVDMDELGNIKGFSNGRRIGTTGEREQTGKDVHQESSGSEHFLLVAFRFILRLFGIK